MADEPRVPVDRVTLTGALAYALRFRANGRAHRDAHELASFIVAELLAEHLERSGWVVMRRNTTLPPSTALTNPTKAAEQTD